MKLEWDEAKRRQTLRERGLDFADVAALEWDSALTREDTRNAYAERRFSTLGFLNGRLCVFIWCERQSGMRIISMRKANAREVKLYENA